MRLSRKQLIQSTGAAGAGILLAGCLDRTTVQAQAPTFPRRLPMYVDPLPTAIPLLTPDTTTYPDADYYEITMRPGSWKFHSRLPKAALTWGYWGRDAVTGKSASLGLGYLGPTIQARSGRPVVVKYVNKLIGRHPVQDSIDFTIAGNTPRASYPIGRAVPHLHGGFTPSQFDGGPHAWWDAHGAHDPMRGYYSLPSQARNEAIYWYSNRQPATLLWYHDHAMGITRLNVYAGLAGLYIVRDQHDTGTPANPLGLPAGAFELPLVLQDKRFTADGSLDYPTTNDEPYPDYPHPKWVTEFFGDTPVINATAYPNLKVEPRRYRFRTVNGSQARFYQFFFAYPEGGRSQRLPFYVLGMEQGFVPGHPKPIEEFLLAPGERVDLLLDFSHLRPGTTLLMQNEAPAPYPDGGEPDFVELMRLQVSLPLSSRDDTADPAKGQLLLPSLTGALVPTVTAATPRRQIIMKELLDPVDYTPVEVKLNERHFDDPIEEKPRRGSTEVWQFVNLTPDAHPMHMHLVRLQVLNRQRFTGEQFWTDYSAWIAAGRPAGKEPDVNGKGSDGHPYLAGPAQAPAPHELGWKDTAVAFPREVLRVGAKFDLPTETPEEMPSAPAEYVYHCHILEHEENDMMRTFEVI